MNRKALIARIVCGTIVSASALHTEAIQPGTMGIPAPIAQAIQLAGPESQVEIRGALGGSSEAGCGAPAAGHDTSHGSCLAGVLESEQPRKIEFDGPEFETAFESFRFNLGLACIPNSKFGEAAVCKSREYGFISATETGLPEWLEKRVSDRPKGAKSKKLFYDVNTLLCHLRRKSVRDQRAVFKQIWDFKKFDPDLDVALLLVVAYRESGALAFHNKKEWMDTYSNGGIDTMGSSLETLKKHYVPRDSKGAPLYGKTWLKGEERRNEAGHIVTPASVRSNELLGAYAAWLHLTRDRAGKKFRKYGMSEDEILNLDPKARRTWMLLAFAGPHGTEFDQFVKSGRGLGLNTLLSYVKSREAPLEIINSPRLLKHYKRMQIARAYSVNTALIQEALGL